jgi:hypothetical protein
MPIIAHSTNISMLVDCSMRDLASKIAPASGKIYDN